MKMRHAVLLLSLALAAAGCTKPKPVAEITTRQGGHFLVVDPQADYVRICYEGEVDALKNMAWQGLRIDSAEVKAPSQEEQEIPWDKIEHIDFGTPYGDLGEFCPGLPEYIAADVHYPDGRAEQHKLMDTTDDGINGLTERGKVVIPLRNVASLRVVKNEDWPWASAEEKHYDVTLTVTWSNGKVTQVQMPHYGFSYSKQHGDDLLQSPFSDFTYDFPALIHGARVDLSWSDIRSIDVESKPGEPEKDKLTFTDGHTEEVGVAGQGMEFGDGSDDRPAEDGVYMVHMEVHSKLQQIPKPGS